MIAKSKRGLTFIEVLVTLVILSAGIVVIYRSFFLCIDYARVTACRLRANDWLEEKIIQTQMSFAQSGAENFVPASDTLSENIHQKTIEFQWQPQIEAVKGMEGNFWLDGQVIWNDGKRQTRMERQAVIGL